MQVIVIGFVLFVFSKVSYTGMKQITKSAELGPAQFLHRPIVVSAAKKSDTLITGLHTGLLLFTLFAIATYFSLNNFL